MELGARFLKNFELSLTWRLARNALSRLSLKFRAGLVDMPDCARCGSGLEETAVHTFYYYERVRPFWDHVGEWNARIEPTLLMLLDVGYIVDNVLPPFQGEKRVVFSSCSQNGDLDDAKEGLSDDASFSHCDLILFFSHQLWVKIRCDRKRLDRITFDKRWMNLASLVVQKGIMLESYFPRLPTHGVCGPSPSEPHPG